MLPGEYKLRQIISDKSPVNKGAACRLQTYMSFSLSSSPSRFIWCGMMKKGLQERVPGRSAQGRNYLLCQF